MGGDEAFSDVQNSFQ